MTEPQHVRTTERVLDAIDTLSRNARHLLFMEVEGSIDVATLAKAMDTIAGRLTEKASELISVSRLVGREL